MIRNRLRRRSFGSEPQKAWPCPARPGLRLPVFYRFGQVFRPSDSAAIIRFSHASDVLFVAHLERFDARRLGRFLRLSSRDHEIVMVIAIGKKSPGHTDQPQWRRPLESTVTIL